MPTRPETNDSNGIVGTTPQNPLEPGIYAPTVAFFTSSDTIDVETTAAHAKRLAHAGITGLVTHGSNGEAVHLDREERQVVTRATRSALDAAGKPHVPIIVGCGAQSTRETLGLCRDAAASGGSHALVLPPSYYGALLTTDLIVEHFCAVADASPIPLVVYNFPAPCGGLDLNSDTILRLARHPKIVGVKLTCGNTGKLARIVAGTKDSHFRVFGGSADFTIQTLSVGGHGVIAGLANVAPKACNEVMRLWSAGRTDEAVAIQAVVARGDWAAIKGGFVSVKAALQRHHGYGGQPRKPCALLEGEALEAQMGEFAELVELEQSMGGSSACVENGS
ncbi:dihydrodipicolinate synthetase family protein [Hirsutella rhossiliensis]|uniref:Dihydrodipicolinate synthetase family domain-containing protein n=1 Tax=Hirsutella rhossiliensis TaxID=111463 RepID=A0A9P8SEB0_9HYPO|nr:dihydrodipicolinate synthetase family domain-containing protein [Hirsutella rhossiliensis]KAH0957846.1 dihydrodipicolinate synthetase family domain-containing protein [Hirsutella rhossiliensis]